MTTTNRSTPSGTTAIAEQLEKFLAEAERLQAAGHLPVRLFHQLEACILEGTEPSRMQMLVWSELVRDYAGA